MSPRSQRSHGSQAAWVVEEETHFSAAGAAEGEGIDLHNYWRVIKKRQWQIFVFFCLVVGTVACGAMLMASVYTASATLLVEPKAPEAMNIKQVFSPSLEITEHDYLQTQASLLKSRALASEVVQGAELGSHPFFQKKPPNLLGRLGQLFGVMESLEDASRQPALSKLIDAYLDTVTIEPAGKTNLIKIAVSTPDPALSTRLANLHAEVYIRHGLRFRTQASEAARHALEKKLGELRGRVEKAETALNDYSEEKGILALDSKENIVVERLADLNTRLTAVEAQRVGLEAQWRSIQSRSYDTLPEVNASILIQELKQEKARLEGELADLSIRLTVHHPQLIQLRAKLKKTGAALDQELHAIADRIESAYLAAQRQENALRATLEGQKTKAFRLKNDSVKYSLLVREVETSGQLYDNVLQRMKEVEIEEEIQASNVFIIDPAEVPRDPARPQRKKIVLLGAGLGLIGGLGLAFFFEFLDDTVKTPEEVERLLQLPNLGTVPDFQGISNRRTLGTDRPILSAVAAFGSLFTQGESWGTPHGHASRPASARRQTAVSRRELSHLVVEAYRSLHTAIQLSQTEEPLKTLLFTSGKPGEGKTTTVINTAIHFAQMGARVLVLDADLRRPSCHRGLQLDKGIGLTELLTGQCELREVVRRPSDKNGQRRRNVTNNLFFISSGSTPPNPTKLLGSKNMRALLHCLRQSYDYILIDSPPVIPVSDARLLSTLADGVVLVVDGQHTPKAVAREACARLRHAHSKLLGVVLNRMDLRNGSYEELSYPAAVQPEYEYA